MNDRIKSIADAATRLFLRQGYSKTQISHIANAVGVSVGTIYLDFVGKKEILHFILKCMLDSDFADREFHRPITDELFVGLENEIVATFEKTGNDFAKHLAEAGTDYTLEALLSDAFDMLSKYAAGCLFIEKNQLDFPFLAEHYKQYRKKFLETMTKYMTAFVQCGKVRPLEHIDLSTTLIVEILTWWAMDRRYISFETINIPSDTAKEVCVDSIVAAYRQKN